MSQVASLLWGEHLALIQWLGDLQGSPEKEEGQGRLSWGVEAHGKQPHSFEM